VPDDLLELTPVQRKELHGALIEAFPTKPGLTRMVDFELGQSLDVISTASSLADITYELLKWAQATGNLGQLVNAARTANPGNVRLRRFEESIVRARNERPQDPALRQFADQVHLSPGPAVTPQQLERIVEEGAENLSIEDWLRAQSRSELAVCLVEFGGKPGATGFLIGPDLIMTAGTAVGNIANSRMAATLRFDYRAYGDGQTLTAGQPYGLAAMPVADSSPVEIFDYAVLRADGRPGDDPVGGQAGAPPRGWLVPVAHEFRQGESLFVIQHPEGAPLKISHGSLVEVATDTSTFADPPAQEPRIVYDVPTGFGSGGGPIFSRNWELVGIHEGNVQRDRRDRKRGVSMTPIIPRLKKKGLLL